MLPHDGSRRVPAKKGKMEHCRCIAKLPWQKEFQRFVPLSKAGKRSTTWQHFFLFSVGTICILLVPVCVFVAAQRLARKMFFFRGKASERKKEKQDWIDQTNIRAASAKWLLEYSQKESTKTRTYWRTGEKEVKRHIIRWEGKTCDTQTLRHSSQTGGIKPFATDPNLKGKTILVCPCPCRKMTVVNLFSFPPFSPHHCSEEIFLFCCWRCWVKHGNMWFSQRKFVIRRFSSFYSPAPPQEF